MDWDLDVTRQPRAAGATRTRDDQTGVVAPPRPAGRRLPDERPEVGRRGVGRRPQGLQVPLACGAAQDEDDPNAFGRRGARDVAAAIDFLSSRPEVNKNRIGGIGLSVGGETMITAAAGDDRLAVVVSEGAGERSAREFTEVASGADRMGLPLYAPLFSNGSAPGPRRPRR